jgi:lipoprotein-anchoring transpeptidase ErfK/SrfK
VKIGTLDAGGLDRGQARALVRRRLAGGVRAPVAATYERQRFVLRPQDASARVDVDATVDAAMRSGRAGDPFSRVLGGDTGGGTVATRVTYSRAAVASFVARTARGVDRKAADADIDWRNGKLIRTHARNGVVVRRAQLTAAIVRALGSPAGSRTAKIPVTVTQRPDRKLADFAARYPTVIAVDRSAKVLRLYKHLRLAERYKIAVGRAGLETAAGRYKIREKIVNPPWHVPNSSWAGALAGRTIAPNDPQNPLVARWLGFYNGQGIHGTDDIASLGTAASHGCIRMAVPDVKRLYSEVRIGTPLFLQ